MKRFLLSTDYRGGETAVIAGRDFHYLCRVRRMRPGDSCDAADRTGNLYRLTVEILAADSCTVRLEPGAAADPGTVETGAADGAEITLFQCLPKGTKLDLIIRQATEAGVRRIVPLLSEHAVPRVDTAAAATRKLDRWRRIAREAVQQSGATLLPDVSAPIPFADLESRFTPGHDAVGLFCHQLRLDGVRNRPLEQRTLHEYLSADSQRIAIVIGPEGGLSNSEIEQLLQSGFEPVYLGPQVLRTETAALYAIAAVQIVLLEKKTWRIGKD